MLKWMLIATAFWTMAGCYRIELVKCDLNRTVYVNSWFCVERIDENAGKQK
ncbi:MAG: hypothetical protein KKD99_13605 [Proteobacteria bacterium]|nr:hypothetical protein [Pseudomonadota bacterium]